MDQVIEQLKADANLMTQLGVTTDNLPMRRAALTRKVNLGYEIATNELDQVNVTFTDENPAFARWAINSLVNNYINRTRQQIDQRLRQSAVFFENEVDASRARIEELENQKLVFEIEKADLLPDNPNSLQNALAAAKARLAELTRDRSATLVRIRGLEEAIEDTPALSPKTITQRNPELARLETEHRQTEEQLSLFLNTYRMTERHPDVTTLRTKLVEIQQRIDQTDQEVVAQRETSSNPKREELELQLTRAQGELDALTAHQAALNDHIAGLEKQTDQMYGVRSAYLKIDREIAQVRRQLGFWEDNLRRLDMVRAAESGDRGIRLSFLKPCPPLIHPISPQWMQVVMAAIGLGLVAGAVSVLFAHRTDATFHRGTELAASLDLPLLGSVSEIISAQQRRTRQIRRMVLYPLNFAAMAAVLIFMASLLYLNLQRPELFSRLTSGVLVKGLSTGDVAAPRIQED